MTNATLEFRTLTAEWWKANLGPQSPVLVATTFHVQYVEWDEAAARAGALAAGWVVSEVSRVEGVPGSVSFLVRFRRNSSRGEIAVDHPATPEEPVDQGVSTPFLQTGTAVVSSVNEAEREFVERIEDHFTKKVERAEGSTTVPRCGDAVLHRPSGETWQVAWADPERDELCWVGWPDGVAKLSDCELKRRCTDAEHKAMVRRLRVLGSNDSTSKSSGVRRIYGAEHGLKAWPRYFDDVLSGKKTFEVRRNDRDFRVGDFLILCDTPRRLRVRVTYLLLVGETVTGTLDGEAFSKEAREPLAVMAIVPDEDSP